MKTARLGDVCEQIRETIKPGKRPELRYIGLESIEAGTGMFAEGELSKTPESPLATSFRFGPEHVLYGKLRPYLNKVVTPDFEGKCSTEIAPLLPASNIDRRYLAYFLRKPEIVESISAKTAGARMPRADMDFVFSLPIPLRSLAEQIRDVDTLSRAEGIVRLRREAERKSAELVAATFIDMFGDPTTNTMGWTVAPLQSVALVGSGFGFPITYQGKHSGAYPFYKVSDMNLKGNEVEMKEANNYISEEDMVDLRAKSFPKGTVIFPKIGAAIATNKKRILTINSCFDNNVMGITPGDGIVPSYLHALICAKNLSDFASDSNPPSIRKTTVEDWVIPVPPYEAQVKFDHQVGLVRSIQAQQAAATVKAQETFDALLAQIFSTSENERRD